ncbi:ABC transporter ATP-binding protein [Paenibacillus monticola]|uniref:ATP-binding cassette domain-containing protein n=1 Tax=Paenibacillus monticola TaxID=2666075 RepID=A0A7X2H749_9BACL|nr:ATP-binding cassette domain-containing protein [Paenibacillus monticola]MRN54754.1 ATP-binding cassette domain-containing protein [Paenibacillus monticola]
MTNIVLETKDLTKVIHGKPIVSNVNIQVSTGDIFGFLGPNGAGKTTTIRMITHLVFPTSGEIWISGLSLREHFKEAISKVGCIVENPTFYPNLSAYQNLKLSAALLGNIQNERIEEVLTIVGLASQLKQKVGTFSLGMKQRLGIANAILGYPKLVILDEPTNGVDPIGLREMKALIKELANKEKITFFISSHMLREMEDLCNKVAIIQKGEILAQGQVSSLLAAYSVVNLEDLFLQIIQGDINNDKYRNTLEI